MANAIGGMWWASILFCPAHIQYNNYVVHVLLPFQSSWRSLRREDGSDSRAEVGELADNIQLAIVRQWQCPAVPLHPVPWRSSSSDWSLWEAVHQVLDFHLGVNNNCSVITHHYTAWRMHVLAAEQRKYQKNVGARTQPCLMPLRSLNGSVELPLNCTVQCRTRSCFAVWLLTRSTAWVRSMKACTRESAVLCTCSCRRETTMCTIDLSELWLWVDMLRQLLDADQYDLRKDFADNAE